MCGCTITISILPFMIQVALNIFQDYSDDQVTERDILKSNFQASLTIVEAICCRERVNGNELCRFSIQNNTI